jgi:hypothetical protein
MHTEYEFSLDESLLHPSSCGISRNAIISHAQSEFKKYGDCYVSQIDIEVPYIVIGRKGNSNKCDFVLYDDAYKYLHEVYIVCSCINIHFDSCDCEYHRVLDITYSNHSIELRYAKIARRRGEAVFPYVIIQSHHKLDLTSLGGRRYCSSGPEYEYISLAKVRDTIEAFISKAMIKSTWKEICEYYEC